VRRTRVATALVMSASLAVLVSARLDAQRGGRGGGRGAAAPAPEPAGPRSVVVIGCTKSTGSATSKDATITDYRSGGSTFHLDASDQKIAPWIGDTLEIHGMVPEGTPAVGNAPLKLNAQSVYVIGRGCTLPPQS
jgi:hypothetical protein